MKYSKREKLDQFFTPDEVALEIVENFKKLTGFDGEIVEPCAGGGAFIRAFEKVGYDYKAYDIDPQLDNTIKMDFRDFKEDLSGKAVITNPPFGVYNEISINFFNKITMLNAEYIVFLALNSFVRPYQVNRLDYRYTLEDKKYQVIDFLNINGDIILKKLPCSISVWKRNNIISRKKYLIGNNNKYFTTTNNYKEADIMIHYRGLPRRIYYENFREKEYYVRWEPDGISYLKFNDVKFLEIIKKYDKLLHEASDGRPPSLGLSTINNLIEEVVNNERIDNAVL